MDVAEVLRAARDLYAANPSHALPGEDPMPGQHCVATALGSAARYDSYTYDATYVRARDALLAAVGMDEDDSLVEWNAENDTPTVLAGFDAAIASVS